MIELRDLRTLLAIGATGSLTLAAQRLHTTQSALSHQLRALEQRLGIALINRATRPLKLTQAGWRLAALAQEVLPRIEAVEQEVRALAAGRAGRLYVASECHSCLEWLLPRLRHYRRLYPAIELDVSLSVSLDPLPALLAGTVDAVLTPDRRELPGLLWEALFDYAMVAVVAPDHPLAAKAVLEAQDLRNQTLLVYPVERERLDVFRRVLWPAGVEPARVRTVDSSQMLLELAALGQGVAVLPDWLCARAAEEGRVRLLRVGEAGLTARLYAALRAAEADWPHLAAFVAELRSNSGACSQAASSCPSP